MPDRAFGLAAGVRRVDVRRLMYQSLIWRALLRQVPGDDSRRLLSPLDSKRVQCLADALIDRVRGDFELGCDLFRGHVLIDQAQAVDLALAQARNAFLHAVIRLTRIVLRARRIDQS